MTNIIEKVAPLTEEEKSQESDNEIVKIKRMALIKQKLLSKTANYTGKEVSIELLKYSWSSRSIAERVSMNITIEGKEKFFFEVGISSYDETFLCAYINKCDAGGIDEITIQSVERCFTKFYPTIFPEEWSKSSSTNFVKLLIENSLLTWPFKLNDKTDPLWIANYKWECEEAERRQVEEEKQARECERQRIIGSMWRHSAYGRASHNEVPWPEVKPGERNIFQDMLHNRYF